MQQKTQIRITIPRGSPHTDLGETIMALSGLQNNSFSHRYDILPGHVPEALEDLKFFGLDMAMPFLIVIS